MPCALLAVAARQAAWGACSSLDSPSPPSSHIYAHPLFLSPLLSPSSSCSPQAAISPFPVAFPSPDPEGC